MDELPPEIKHDLELALKAAGISEDPNVYLPGFLGLGRALFNSDVDKRRTAVKETDGADQSLIDNSISQTIELIFPDLGTVASVGTDQTKPLRIRHELSTGLLSEAAPDCKWHRPSPEVQAIYARLGYWNQFAPAAVRLALYDTPKRYEKFREALRQTLEREGMHRLRHKKTNERGRPSDQVSGAYRGSLVTSRSADYPKPMYHAVEPSRSVGSAREQAELGPDWSPTYLYKAYPKAKYHFGGTTKDVNTLAEEQALGGGWTDNPADFDAYRGSRKAQAEHDPELWVDAWPVAGLLPEHRRKIKSSLLRVDSAFWNAPDAPAAEIVAMRAAYDEIANVLSYAKLLSTELLQDQIPALAWDSAVAAGWFRMASETPKKMFREPLGHYWVWREQGGDWRDLFRPEFRKWRSRLLLEEHTGNETVPTTVNSQSVQLSPVEVMISLPTLSREERGDAETDHTVSQIAASHEQGNMAILRGTNQGPETSAQAARSGRTRGRRPNLDRRGAIATVLRTYGDDWRNHLSEIAGELDAQGVELGDFARKTIDLGDGKTTGVSKWEDLDLAIGSDRNSIFDALRKYLD